jgi:hypothetical protein
VSAVCCLLSAGQNCDTPVTLTLAQAFLSIVLESDSDLDINIYELKSGVKSKRLVGWCGQAGCDMGYASQSFAERFAYKGMGIGYSGFNGVEGKLGKEYINITGSTTIPVLPLSLSL